MERNRLPFTGHDRQGGSPGRGGLRHHLHRSGESLRSLGQDWGLPLQYGIRQVYGENGGPGGLFHALRIVPPILAICHDAGYLPRRLRLFLLQSHDRDHDDRPSQAPEAQVRRALPRDRLAAALPARHLGHALEELSFRAAGLNHFSALIEARREERRGRLPRHPRQGPGHSSPRRNRDTATPSSIRPPDGRDPRHGGRDRALQAGPRRGSRPWSDRPSSRRSSSASRSFPSRATATWASTFPGPTTWPITRASSTSTPSTN